jgi:glycosyltransferase involved in cell wall biosynthesis
MKVVYIYADMPQELNCSKHNCLRPAEALNRSGKHQAKILHVRDFSSNRPEVINFIGDSDMVVFERNFFGDALPAIEFWRVRNKPILGIFDDAYHIITKDNPSYSFWHDNKLKAQKDSITGRVSGLLEKSKDQDKLWNDMPEDQREIVIRKISKILNDKVPETTTMIDLDVPAIKQFRWGLKKVRGIQVPSKMLAQDWQDVNDVYFIPNRIEANKYIHARRLFEKEDEDEIVVGWHGSLSHVSSFEKSGISKALEIVAKKYKNVIIYLGGDKKNFNLVDLPRNKKRYHNYVPDQKFPSLLKTIDIAIAPLVGAYDHRRSWVRGLEYMALQIPWASSKSPTYEDLADYHTVVENSVDNWVEALSDMVENYGDYKKEAEGAPFEFAVSQDYDNHVDEQVEAYKKCIEKEYD